MIKKLTIPQPVGTAQGIRWGLTITRFANVSRISLLRIHRSPLPGMPFSSL